MSQKTISKKFNAYGGKIINLAEFETTLQSVQERSGGPFTAVRDALHRIIHLKSDAAPWPVIYTADTTDEAKAALETVDRVEINKDKVYFEASSMMAMVDAEGCLTSAFKESIKKSADQREKLGQGVLSEIRAGDEDLKGYGIDISLRREISIGAYVVPDYKALPSEPKSQLLAVKMIDRTHRRWH